MQENHGFFKDYSDYEKDDFEDKLRAIAMDIKEILPDMKALRPDIKQETMEAVVVAFLKLADNTAGLES